MQRGIVFRASMLMAAVSALAGTANAQRIQIPVGFRFTWIGARWQPDAKVLDSRTGRPITATLAYRVADPAVATVSSRGEVTARKPGNTKLWAIAGRDSASALIVVEPQPAKFTFSPANVRFDALGVKQQLRVLASDSGGVPIVGGTSRVSACRSTNERVAVLAAGEVTSVANGSAWIRCSDRGIADSIRIEVQQRTVAAIITNKTQLTRTRSAGDTFSIRVSSRDRMQKEVPEARPTWASLNPYVVSVDPVTGRARAVGGGDTRVIVQVGDVGDSVSISVGGAPAPMPNSGPVVVDSAATSKATLDVSELFTWEGDTTFVSITAIDSAGATIGPGALTIRIADTTVAGRLDSTRIVARKAGTTQIFVRYGEMIDSAFLNVRVRQTGSSTSGASGAAAAAAFRAPDIPDSTADHQRLTQEVQQRIATDPTLSAIRQNLVMIANVAGGIAEHLAETESGTIENRTGPLVGGTATLLFYQRLELTGTYRQGSLASVDTVSEPLDVKEAEASLGIFPVRQLGLRGGVVLRGQKSGLAYQTWFIPKVSLVSRFSFIGDVFNTYAAFSVLPKALSSRGDTDADKERGALFSRGGEAGIEFKLARATGLNGGLTYYVEKITFDGSDRTDSFSSVRLRFGFNIGK